MKKALALIAAVSLVTSATIAPVTASDETNRSPAVYLDNQEIEFADQKAYITDEGRTLVPARGVFEAMDCTVAWDAADYVVTITHEELEKEIILKIDDTAMKVVTSGKEEVVTLDVPAQLMNDRTMIPLRAVSEAIGCGVDWNGEQYRVDLTSVKVEKEYDPLTSKIYLKAPTGTVRVGDTISVPVVISDAKSLKGAMFKVNWDPKQLQLVGTNVKNTTKFEGFTDVSALFNVFCDINTSGAESGYVTVAGGALEAIKSESKDYQLGVLHFKVLPDAKDKTVKLEFDTTDLKTSGNNGEVNLSFAGADGTSFTAKAKATSGGGGGGSSSGGSSSSGGGSGSKPGSGSSGGSSDNGGSDDNGDSGDNGGSDDNGGSGDNGDNGGSDNNDPEVEEPEVQDPAAVFSLGTVSGVPGETVSVDVSLETTDPVNLIAVYSFAFSQPGVRIVGFEFSEEAKAVMNTGLSSFDLANKALVVLFNESIQFNGVIGTLTIEIDEDVASEVDMSAQSNIKNEDVSQNFLPSTVVNGKIEL